MMEFTYNDQKQTIMGIHITDYKQYLAIRDAVQITVYEGWKPTINQIKLIIKNDQDPMPELRIDLKQFFNEN